MKFDLEALKGLLQGIADNIVADGRATAESFWSEIEADSVPAAKEALRRYGENQLDALRYPDQAESFHKAAAHNLNTLTNIGAGNQIHARREARKLLDRVFAQLLDAAESVIDVIL